MRLQDYRGDRAASDSQLVLNCLTAISSGAENPFHVAQGVLWAVKI